jgi:recombinational DNA repair ATPase RecF
MQIVQALVEIQPIDTGLVLDNVFGFLDNERAKELIGLFSNHRKQTIMSGKGYRIDAMRKYLEQKFRLVTETNTVPSLICCS